MNQYAVVRRLATTALCGAAFLGCGTEDAATPGVATEDSLLAAAVDRVVGGADGDQLDRGCVQETFSGLAREQLELINSAETESTDPRLASISLQLLDCLDFATQGANTADAGGGDGGGDAALTSPCSLLSPTMLAPLYAGLQPGEALSAITPFGEGDGCEWATTDGKSVNLFVVPGADLAGWAAEAEDGDHMSDGDPVGGIGAQAFSNGGDLSFAHGTTLVTIDCFPSFDIDPEALAAIARLVDAQL